MPELVNPSRPGPGSGTRPRDLGLPAEPGGPRADHRPHRQPRPDRARPGQPVLPQRGQGRAGPGPRGRLRASSSPTPTRTPTAEAEPGAGADASRSTASSSARRGWPTTICARSPPTPRRPAEPARRARIPAVTVDNADGIRQAVAHLSRSATAGSPTSPGRARPGPTASGRGGCARPRGGRASSWSQLGHFPPRFEGGVAAADQVLASGATAVIAYNDLVALGLLSRLRARGVAVPGDISVHRLRRHRACRRWSTRPLTTVALPKEQAGRAGVDLLLSLLARARRRPGHRAGSCPPSSSCAPSTGRRPGYRRHDRPRPLDEGNPPMTHATAALGLTAGRWSCAPLLVTACGAPGSPAPRPSPARRRCRTSRPQPVTLNILDVAGNLAADPGHDRRLRGARTRTSSRKVTYSKAAAPELAGKIKAQQNANRVDIDLVLTGVDGLSAGIEQGLWTAAAAARTRTGCRGMNDYLPGAAAMQKLAGDHGRHGHLLPVRAADRVPAGEGAEPAEDRRGAARLRQGQPGQGAVRPAVQLRARPHLPDGPAVPARRLRPEGPGQRLGQDLGLPERAEQVRRRSTRPAPRRR